MDYVTLLIGFYFGYAIRHLYGLWNMTYVDQAEFDEEQKMIDKKRDLLLAHPTGKFVMPVVLFLSALIWPISVILVPFRKLLKKKLM